MIFVQVLLGGITRLTGSGLSITQWDLIMGTLPPQNQQAWDHAFDLYRQTPQFKIMNSSMTLISFKAIFFWEYLHRLWARLFIIVFVFPIVYFLFKKMISRQLLIKALIAFMLGALQGLLGWIMVSSGLTDKPSVNAVDLSAHLVLALVLYCYLFWVALETIGQSVQDYQPPSLKKFSYLITGLLFVQIFYGGLMAGNHAALFYPTFPKFGDKWIPDGLFIHSPAAANLFSSVAMIQVIHRSLGLFIGLAIGSFYYACRKKRVHSSLMPGAITMLILVVIQITLGILTLWNSLGKIPVFTAEVHQIVALLLLTASVYMNYCLSAKKFYIPLSSTKAKAFQVTNSNG